MIFDPSLIQIPILSAPLAFTSPKKYSHLTYIDEVAHKPLKKPLPVAVHVYTDGSVMAESEEFDLKVGAESVQDAINVLRLTLDSARQQSTIDQSLVQEYFNDE